ncbi:Desulfoferrodoxin [bioreactor metagenome]|uniref:Desulfoferrodoxin n=1 Tax=bioreactor metagenome TaxID=1076179 RepID=A0A645DK73_9ZZZZ
MVEVDGNNVTVTVGSVIHPMTEEHHISWIVVETTKGYQVKYLEKTGEPKASFVLAEGEEVKTVYEYCNLHGLWKK